MVLSNAKTHQNGQIREDLSKLSAYLHLRNLPPLKYSSRADLLEAAYTRHIPAISKKQAKIRLLS
jgi:hypothetical protein